ncbi:hypothetical protein J3Q64DRAFT_1734303 [Phycomyces blakesleeanus]|uniref:Uncharacterized protein n=2 Tax=Phycomyces blakesleeanus TaxID=4837 RepID=A0A167L363_PHYB8|nr:hypothetical protein PHYBLDRAFT_66291 [Phycomyces blakesleeanus NRRL 1555(-)]OAD69487.1 hypothetical protein PHYBLDRAFT_66291 [Phycomyces blakesleeanus NRRL 1555(-)]|eukprot:XP_018287527.1 hypothetical protein PHYBLDRAFT_66291 [Phycomyces blakesleeanus NRRL 1555(-)]
MSADVLNGAIRMRKKRTRIKKDSNKNAIELPKSNIKTRTYTKKLKSEFNGSIEEVDKSIQQSTVARKKHKKKKESSQNGHYVTRSLSKTRGDSVLLEPFANPGRIPAAKLQLYLGALNRISSENQKEVNEMTILPGSCAQASILRDDIIASIKKSSSDQEEEDFFDKIVPDIMAENGTSARFFENLAHLDECESKDNIHRIPKSIPVDKSIQTEPISTQKRRSRQYSKADVSTQTQLSSFDSYLSCSDDEFWEDALEQL